MIQEKALIVSLVLMALVALTFCFVAVNATHAKGLTEDHTTFAYRIRGWIFSAAVIFIVLVNYLTLGHLPYDAGVMSPYGIKHATAVGEQWTWNIQPTDFNVGDTAEFELTTKDVNHGFAIYDPNGKVVAQAQAMPGYTNLLRYKFAVPGIYQVRCLEYCGIGHHGMVAAINVAETLNK